MSIEDLSSYYSGLTLLDKFRFRRLCHHRNKYIKLTTKLEKIEELMEEFE